MITWPALKDATHHKARERQKRAGVFHKFTIAEHRHPSYHGSTRFMSSVNQYESLQVSGVPQTRTHGHGPGWTDLRALLLAAGALLASINLGFGVVTLHVLHTAGYRTAGRLPEVLPWALGLNVSVCILIFVFGWRGHWRGHLPQILGCTVLVSMLPFLLPRALRLPTAEQKLYAFGLIYVLFLFSAGILTIWYACANAHLASRRSLRIWILSATMMVYAGTTGWMRVSSGITGDEPHYLLLTHSLVHDHDFDLSNNYAHQDYRAFYPAPMQPETVPGQNGSAMLWHDVGLPILLVPGYALAGRTGAMLTVNVITSLLALGIFEAALELGAGSASAIVTWGVFALSAPFMIYSSQLYPETAGAAGALWGVILFSRFIGSRQRRFLWYTGTLLGLLPWLCIRFWMYVGPLWAVIGFFIIIHRKARVLGEFVALGFPLCVSLGLFAWFDARHFGTVLPNAGYLKVAAVYPQYTHVEPIRGLLGLMFDRLQGVIPIAPIYLWGLAGLAAAWKRARWPVTALVAPSFSYLFFMAFSQYWTGGYCPPARYALGTVALWAPAAATVLHSHKRRWLFGAAVLWSGLIAIAYTAFPHVRYPDLNHLASSGLVLFVHPYLKFNYDQAFPSLIRNARSDQILAGAWVLLAVTCVWFLNHTSKGEQKLDEVRQSTATPS